jgi:hypothetical protein
MAGSHVPLLVQLLVMLSTYPAGHVNVQTEPIAAPEQLEGKA